jgi:hypothetical protein
VLRGLGGPLFVVEQAEVLVRKRRLGAAPGPPEKVDARGGGSSPGKRRHQHIFRFKKSCASSARKLLNKKKD